jgi:hypothetical protein
MSDIKQPEAPVTVKQLVDLLPTLVATAVGAAQRANAQPAAVPIRAANVAPIRCHDCGQQKSACEGKHVQLVVYPTRYPQHARFFPGAILNGIKYLSNDEGHTVTVPACAEATIMNLVSGYEQNEQEMAVGRKAERRSGVVSPNGTNVQQANQAWR